MKKITHMAVRISGIEHALCTRTWNLNDHMIPDLERVTCPDCLQTRVRSLINKRIKSKRELEDVQARIAQLREEARAKPKTYRSRTTTEAMLVTNENMAAVAEWCGGRLVRDPANDPTIWVDGPGGDRHYARPGSIVYRSQFQKFHGAVPYLVSSPNSFDSQWEEVER